MQQGFFRVSGMVIHDHHASKKTEHPFKLLSFPVGGSLQRAEVGHFRKAPKLYSLRHTFLTRLGESGCDAWTLARIAGHSNVSMSSRYVHPSEGAVLTAMARLGGHNIGHNENQGGSNEVAQKQLTQ